MPNIHGIYLVFFSLSTCFFQGTHAKCGPRTIQASRELTFPRVSHFSAVPHEESLWRGHTLARLSSRFDPPKQGESPAVFVLLRAKRVSILRAANRN